MCDCEFGDSPVYCKECLEAMENTDADEVEDNVDEEVVPAPSGSKE